MSANVFEHRHHEVIFWGTVIPSKSRSVKTYSGPLAISSPMCPSDTIHSLPAFTENANAANEYARSLGAPGGCCRGGLALLALGPSVGSFSSYQYPWLPVALSCWRFELNFFLPI
ncbi:hypothetical protein GLOIN_2v1783698 [Rhizophagus irregularis DAOM 181602=DAOM 197198]|nr:hypothetical protein GLOIN_2v1783698 [Rhizophagus irregularis DAOM 181602=DAOM 197198]